MQEKELLELKGLFADLSKVLVCGVKVTGPLAPQVAGHIMQALGRPVSVKDVITYMEILVKKPTDLLTEAEVSLLQAMGLLQFHKPLPAKALTQAGRNDLCPCGSGRKYKQCCMDMVKAHERNTNYGIR